MNHLYLKENEMTPLLRCILEIADNNLILSQQLSLWCGHGPILEQDIALTNIALDLLGQARLYYQYAAEIDTDKKNEDSYAFFRNDRQFVNSLLVERPNGHWGQTILRQFYYDAFHKEFLIELRQSSDQRLADIADKSLKEVNYHYQFSSDWVQRLGDGTEESNKKMQDAVHELHPYSQDYFYETDADKILSEQNIFPNLHLLQPIVEKNISEILQKATLALPSIPYMQTGGKLGLHSEHLGYILSELQYMQRAYPGLQW